MGSCSFQEDNLYASVSIIVFLSLAQNSKLYLKRVQEHRLKNHKTFAGMQSAVISGGCSCPLLPICFHIFFYFKHIHTFIALYFSATLTASNRSNISTDNLHILNRLLQPPFSYYGFCWNYCYGALNILNYESAINSIPYKRFPSLNLLSKHTISLFESSTSRLC